MNEMNEIGPRLRELREASDYTVERLAAELKVDPDVYRGYEQDGKDIPISLIYEVANKFGVDFAEILTGTPARLDTYHIVRRGHGRVVNRNPEYHFEDLAYRYADKVMQPLLVTLGAWSGLAGPTSKESLEQRCSLLGVRQWSRGMSLMSWRQNPAVHPWGFNSPLSHQPCINLPAHLLGVRDGEPIASDALSGLVNGRLGSRAG